MTSREHQEPVFLDRRLASDGVELLQVFRDFDGYWTFWSDGQPTTEGVIVAGLGQVRERWPDVIQLADLGPGEYGARASVGTPWRRERFAKPGP